MSTRANVNETDETADVKTTDDEARRKKRRRRISSIVFLIFGLGVAAFLTTQGPQEQHVNIVLGSMASEVTGVALQYVAASTTDGEISREAHFSFAKGQAPRVLAHEPHLPNGDYRVQIDVDARDDRRSVQRQVTLGGGSTQIDISSAISAFPKDSHGN